MGIEPTSSAWKAEVLPLNYTRMSADQPFPNKTPNLGISRSSVSNSQKPLQIMNMVEGEGFEPSKAEPSDLQSDPFGHSGTPPKNSGKLSFIPPSMSTY